MTWTPEEEEQLRELWLAGHSASRIAKLMGKPSRNSVLGKLHRMGLTGERERRKKTPGLPETPAHGDCDGDDCPPVGHHEEKVTVVASTELMLDYSRPLLEAPTVVEALMLLPLSGCRWVYREDTDGRNGYCGRPKEPGIPYCQYHAKVAYPDWEKGSNDA